MSSSPTATRKASQQSLKAHLGEAGPTYELHLVLLKCPTLTTDSTH